MVSRFTLFSLLCFTLSTKADLISGFSEDDDTASQEPLISEFLASNVTGLTDEDGNFSDWIEIHNPSPSELNLDGWHLTDNDSDLGKWSFPAITLPANSYLVVFSSNENRNAPDSELHTNFKLSAGGEYLALTRPDESIAQQFAPTYPAQSPDLSYNASGFFTPTPGAPNGPPLTNLPPLIVSVNGGEIQPTEGNPIPITASIQPLGGNAISSVTLHYRIGYGTINTSTMTNAGDNYSATIPAGASTGEMVRWYITASSSTGTSSRAPIFEDPIESPEYFGTVIASPTPESDLPILHWFVDNESASETRSGTQASLFFEGQFYDNIFCRTRGQSAAGWPKHKFKFDFHKGGHFKWDSEQPRVEEFNLQSFYREMFSLNSNTSYMREPLMFRYLQDAGVAAPGSKYLHVRRNGGFYGLFSFIEQIDEDFLEKHDYSAAGPLYKATWESGGPATLSPNPTPGQYRKSTLVDEPFTDLESFTDGIATSNPDRFAYVWDNVNLPQWINTIAAMNVPFNHDQLTKNYYVYLEPKTGEWHRFPWDADQAFPVGQYITGENWTNPLYGDRNHTQELSNNSPNPAWANIMHTAIMDNPVTRSMYLRRVKTLADQYLSVASDIATIITENDTARYLAPINSDLDNTWFTPEFDDSGWQSGPQGFGFENSPADYEDFIKTRIRPNEAAPSGTSFYLRFPFTMTAEDVANTPALSLRMRWDDGFVAYINGAEVTRSNVSDLLPTWNTRATAQRRDAHNEDFASFLISASDLVEGSNVLAIHAFNRSVSNSDQLIQLKLLSTEIPYFEGMIAEIQDYIQVEAAADKLTWAAKGITIGSMQVGVDEILDTSLPARREDLFDTYADLLPDTHPSAPDITFGTIEYNPVSGNQDEEFIQIVNNEPTAIDISDWTVSGGIDHSFIPGTVIAPNNTLYLSPNALTFRNRSTSPTRGEDLFVQGNFKGHISNFGELLELRDQNGITVTSIMTPADPSELQQFLSVSEIMYHPVNDDDEFIELLNSSETVTLDLSGVKLTEGIDYEFPLETSLMPGERIVVNFADFKNLSRLSNGSDRIKLEDATNSTIQEFTYRDSFPWPAIADGHGPSIVLINPSLDPDKPTSWRPSIAAGGTPGSTGSSTFSGNPTADNDGDGLSALLEYALGLDDAVSNENPLLLSRQNTTFTLSYPRNLAADDAPLTVEYSTDLSNWSTIDTPLIDANYLGTTQIETIPSPQPVEEKGFYRLKTQSQQ